MGGAVPDLNEVGTKASGDLLTSFRREVASLLGRDRTEFPGAQPVSFARRHLEDLKHRDYYVCEKSDGIRCLLYFTEDSDGRECHYLIDRKNDYYWLHPNKANQSPSFHAPRAPEKSVNPKDPPPEVDYATFHTNTLLDGELLYDTEPDGSRTLKYLVFDCLYMDGQNLTQRSLDKRLAYFKDMLYGPYKKLCQKFPEDVANFVFKLEDKKFQFSYAIHALFNDIIPKLKHGSDGLILTCRETAYRFGTDDNILKWKPAEENTIDFRLSMEFPSLDPDASNTPTINGNAASTNAVTEAAWDKDYDAIPTFSLLVNHSDRDPHSFFANMYATQAEWDTMKRYAIERDDGLEGAIVECHRDSEGRWRFNRFREDKSEANHSSVVKKVAESIEDGVGAKELTTIGQVIRVAWKEREAACRGREKREAEERARVKKEAEERERVKREAEEAARQHAQ